MTVGGVQVRDAQIGDARHIARVHVDSWRETYAGILDERFFTQEAFERRAEYWGSYVALDPRPGRLVIAVEEGEIVGFANSGESIGPDAERTFPVARPLTLFSIYVLGRAHGTGAGQALHDAVVARDPAQLWILKNNSRASAFYQRNGFRFDGVEHSDPADPNLVELRMIR